MVTITIIVVLGTLTMPAYDLVRKRAYWAKTPGQMAKVIEAFHAYQADHNGYFPPAYFPKGAGSAQSTMDDNLAGESGWLNSTIYAQVYPDMNVSAENTDTSSKSSDSGDNTTKSFKQNKIGEHLKDTVFEVQASVLANPQDTNWYNHSFLLNRSLATERIYNQDEFAPRKSDLFTDLTSIMLLTEGLGGEKYNSISVGEATGEALKQGFKRYDDHHVNVGYMDGRVVQVKEKEFPTSPDQDMGPSHSKDAAFLFWRGITKRELDAMNRTDRGRVNY